MQVLIPHRAPLTASVRSSGMRRSMTPKGGPSRARFRVYAQGSGWVRNIGPGSRHQQKSHEHFEGRVQHAQAHRGAVALVATGEAGEFARVFGARDRPRQPKPLIHARAIGTSHALLARRWVSRLARQLSHPLSAVLARSPGPAPGHRSEHRLAIPCAGAHSWRHLVEYRPS